MSYIKTALKEELIVKHIVSIHYFEYAKDYVFEGEAHDFWEFLYVDKGEVEVMADDLGYKLKQGEVIFHKPNEFHNLWANGKVAPNLIVMAFVCNSKNMSFFKNKIIKIGDEEKNLLAIIIKEAKDAFSSRLNDPNLLQLERRSVQNFASEQMVKITLEHFLISLIRKNCAISKNERISKSTKERSDTDTVSRIIEYLEKHIYENISFKDVCSYSGLGRTNLKVLFKAKTGLGVMEYYRRLKIEQAKSLIRQSGMNFTETADKLGYKSVHHFSKHFKKAVGMSPTEYACSVKAKVGTVLCD
ncbi:MAG: AraC family transcriptional regulator [Clostridia bacterium]|nr:AraC family transcriptional regulator [Clostridia bacterium]